jgi:lysophospholipase
LVDNASHEAVSALLPDVQHIVIPGAKHEILMERDELRAPFWEAFDALTTRVAPMRVN